MNQIPMRAGVRVQKDGDPRDGEVGTTIDRFPGEDAVLVEFADGHQRKFEASELVVL